MVPEIRIISHHNMKQGMVRNQTTQECNRSDKRTQPCTRKRKQSPNKKIGRQDMKGIMVGYDDMDGTKAYRIYVPNLKKIVITPDVTFMDFKVITGKIPDVTDQLYRKLENNDGTNELKPEPNETKQVKSETNIVPTPIKIEQIQQISKATTTNTQNTDVTETDNQPVESKVEVHVQSDTNR